MCSADGEPVTYSHTPKLFNALHWTPLVEKILQRPFPRGTLRGPVVLLKIRSCQTTCHRLMTHELMEAFLFVDGAPAFFVCVRHAGSRHGRQVSNLSSLAAIFESVCVFLVVP